MWHSECETECLVVTCIHLARTHFIMLTGGSEVLQRTNELIGSISSAYSNGCQGGLAQSEARCLDKGAPDTLRELMTIAHLAGTQ